eukprot:TRINITY_DN2864_c2_g1_i3.p1 TRINITY_DN2864_c2_g1~~TRINITY_DN2864_c2_g1_i3.p1  ORF type:complete len:223 (-),score=71.68 TRINITY_DN2864_c2_g1_i3:203-871(-)
MSDSEEEQVKQFTAFIVGFSGAIGQELVKELVNSNEYKHVTLFGRRDDYKIPCLRNEDDEEIEELKEKYSFVKIDFNNLDNEEEKEKFNKAFDKGFCCLGTTKKKAGSAEAFRKVDYDYIVNTATNASESGVKEFHLVSSVGAKADSWFLYPQVKGQTENKIKELGFDRYFIYRPSMLTEANREESRLGEQIGLLSLLNNKSKKYSYTFYVDVTKILQADFC